VLFPATLFLLAPARFFRSPTLLKTWITFDRPEEGMAKKSQKRATGKRSRPAAKRDLVRRPKASAYAKRTARGRFKEMDDVGSSQKADTPRKAKKTVRSGYGDQGDERPRTSKRTRR